MRHSRACELETDLQRRRGEESSQRAVERRDLEWNSPCPVLRGVEVGPKSAKNRPEGGTDVDVEELEISHSAHDEPEEEIDDIDARASDCEGHHQASQCFSEEHQPKHPHCER